MKNEKIVNTDIKIRINNNSLFKFSYSYNCNTTFQDLLEHLARLIPHFDICDCYEFEIFGQPLYLNIGKIPKDSQISNYSHKLDRLSLNKKNINCNHSNDNYLKATKRDIYSFFQSRQKSTKILENKINQQEHDLQLKNKEADLLRNNIEKLSINLEKKNAKIDESKNEIENLQKKNSKLIAGINGDLDIIQRLKEFGVQDDNLKEKENLIKINPKTNEIISNQTFVKPNFADFYDIIIHIDSIKDINKGWKIEMNQNGEQNYQNHKNEKVIKIGVIGNANKGKSFLLSKLSKMKLPSGMSIKTEGLSIKYPDTSEFKDRRIVLLDSAGLETPVLKSDETPMDVNENDYFKEKSREKLITELFLQNYIINNSDILIIVVDSLSFSEQKLLIKIKREMDRAKLTIPLYIIHNLKSFTSIQQVEDYIDKTLLKSVTFSLEKGHNISTKIEQNSGIYFCEKLTDKNKNKTKERKVFHLIYANENSEAGKYYNQYTLDLIEKAFPSISDEPFDVIESIKERYIEISKDIIERTKSDKTITKESFDDTIPDLIKLKDESEVTLKKCLIDELGFSNLKANNFEPTYNIYKKNNKLIVRFEVPGNTGDISSEIELSGEYNIIKISGFKKQDKEPEKDDNIFNTREYGNFFFEIPLKSKDYLLSGEVIPLEVKKGVCILEFNLLEKEKNRKIHKIEDEDI